MGIIGKKQKKKERKNIFLQIGETEGHKKDGKPKNSLS